MLIFALAGVANILDVKYKGGGSANDTRIGVEMCEDGLTEKTIGNKLYSLRGNAYCTAG